MSEHNAELKTLLAAWGRACGGEQIQRYGEASLERVRTPAADGNADANVQRVQTAVDALKAIGRWREARVIAVEYLMPEADEARKLDVLSRLGLSISRASYYAHLNGAHLFVAGALWRAGDEAMAGAA